MNRERDAWRRYFLGRAAGAMFAGYLRGGGRGAGDCGPGLF